jgi:hypothetical protein
VSYPKKLLRLKPTRGIASDTPAHMVGLQFYTRGQNVQFRKGFASRILGSRQVYGTLPASVLRMLNARIGGTNFWIFAGADSITARETSNSYDVTPFGGLTAVAQPWEWSATLLNGVPVMSNARDEPIYWDGDTAGEFDTLPGWPAGAICRSIVAFRYHLFALDMDEPAGSFPAKIRWSDAAEPGTVPASWTAAADNEAGDAELGDTPGPVMLGLPLRGSLMIYKRSSMYAVDYIGGNEIFQIRTLFTSSGALTRHAVCDVNGQHFAVTDGDVILTDGTNRRSVAQGRMKDFLFQQLDQDNYENLFAVYHRAKNEVWTCFPESGAQYCTLALVYDVANDAFGVRDLDAVTCAAIGIVNDQAQSEAWDDDDGAWNDDNSVWNEANYSFATESLVLGSGTAATMQDTQDNVTLAASVGRYDLDFGEPERVKFVRRLHVLTNVGAGSLFVRVGSRMTPGGSITWSAEVELQDSDQIVNTFAQGRLICVEIRSEGAQTWTITSIEIEAEIRGYF